MALLNAGISRKLTILLLLGGVSSGCIEVKTVEKGIENPNSSVATPVSPGSVGEPAPIISPVGLDEGPVDTLVADALAFARILPESFVFERTIYVAPPEGSLLGSGSKQDPRRDLLTVIQEARAGDRIFLRPGVYPMNDVKLLGRNPQGEPHRSSVLATRASGTPGKPIIFSTDPDELDAATGKIAVLDFQYGNQHDGVRASCFWMSHDYWIVENLEMKNIWQRGIFLGGHNNLIRNNHFHHLDTPGTNNEGFVVVTASGRPTYNFIMRNHMHHAGILDRSTGAVTDYGGVNVACVYTETRQGYDSTFIPMSGSSPLETIKAGILPADSHVYIYNNHVHHCAQGLATKTIGEGPYFFLSNIIHDVRVGVKTAFSGSVIRDNIIFAGPDAAAGVGIQIGQPGALDNYLHAATNGVGIEIDHNTIVGFDRGFFYQGGWNSRSHHNLIVDETAGSHFQRNQYFWFEGGVWPGIRGEYVLGDLDSNHPYFSTHFANIPSVMFQLGFRKLVSTQNAFSKAPVVGRSDSRNNSDIEGKVFETEYRVLEPQELTRLFRDPANRDYRRNFDVLPEYGSRLK